MRGSHRSGREVSRSPSPGKRSASDTSATTLQSSVLAHQQHPLTPDVEHDGETLDPRRSKDPLDLVGGWT